MDKNILISKLKAIGFTENEARIYLAALESNESPASHIAESADMNRVSAYSILKKLRRKGVVSVVEKKKTQLFTAVAPEIFVEDVKRKADSLEESLPLLKALMGAEVFHPAVRYFEGIDAVKKAYSMTLDSKTEILNYANSKNIRLHWPEYDSEYVLQRKLHKIFLKGIAPDDAEGRKVKEMDHLYYRETRLLEKKHFKVENEIKIFDDKLFIASFEPVTFAIIIESRPVADTQRQIFEISWSFASP